MIRLYPQVVRGENNIQDLRRLLSEIHNENLQQCDQLTEAALRIRELGAELGKADFERKDRLQDCKDAKDVAEVQQARYHEQLTTCVGLRGSLAEADAVHDRLLVRLGQCELASNGRWEVLLARQSEWTSLSSSLCDERDEQRRLCRELADAEERWRLSFAEYGQAERWAERQHDELREALAETQKHDLRAAALEAEGGEADQERSRLCEYSRGLASSLQALGDVDTEYAELRTQVGALVAETKSLQDVVSVAVPTAENLEHELQVSTEGVALLLRLMDSERGDLAAMTGKLAEAEVRNSTIKTDLEAALEGGQEMQVKASSAQEHAQQLESEQQGRLDRLAKVCKEFVEKVEALQEKCEYARESMANVRDKNEGRQQRLDKVSAELEALMAEEKDAELLLESAKKRCQCVVM